MGLKIDKLTRMEEESRTLLIGSSGYIGEYLMRRAFESDLNFTGVDRNEGEWTAYVSDAINLGKEFLSNFDTILFFGGSSSVSAAEREPIGALLNNVMGPVLLASKLDPAQRLIYASSASVYSGLNKLRLGSSLTKSDESASFDAFFNMYDASKSSADRIMIDVLGKHNTTGLRMGTVSGYNGSPVSFRRELVFNSMNLSAIENGVVRMSNPQSGRSLLFLDDLFIAIKHLLAPSSSLPKILNLYSLNTTIQEIANVVSEFHNAVIQEIEPSPTYSFHMESLHSERFFCKSEKTLAQRCEQFVLDWSSR